MTEYLLNNFGHGRLLSAVDADDTVFEVSEDVALSLPSPGFNEAFALIMWDSTFPQEIVYCTSNPGTGLLTVTRSAEDTTARAWLAGTELRNSLTAETIGAMLQLGFIAANLASEAQAIVGTNNTTLMSPLRVTDHFEARTSEFVRDEVLETENAEELRRALGWDVAVFDGTGLEDTFTLPDASWDTEFTRIYVDETFVADTEYTITGDQLVFDTPPLGGTDNIVVVFGENFAFSVSFPGNNTVSTAAIIDGAVTTPKVAGGAITTPKLAASAVSYDKMQNVSVTDKVLGRATAGAGSVEEIDATAAGRAMLAAANAAAQIVLLTTSGWPIPTGMVGYFFTAASPAGWITASGGTIGSAASGGTNRANADTANLYSALWNSTDVADLPIFTSAGAGSTKGATAAADFAANKRLTVPDLRAEFLRGLDLARAIDTDRAMASAQGQTIQSHSHSLVMDAVAAHTHGVNMGDDGNNGPHEGSSGYQGTETTRQTQAGGGHTPTGTVSAAGSVETRPRNIAARPCIKL